MPSPTYTVLLSTVSGYIEKDKATGIIDRQLASKSLAPDKLTAKDLGAIMAALSTATSLYVPDAGRKAELKQKLQALAA